MANIAGSLGCASVIIFVHGNFIDLLRTDKLLAPFCKSSAKCILRSSCHAQGASDVICAIIFSASFQNTVLLKPMSNAATTEVIDFVFVWDFSLSATLGTQFCFDA